MAQPTSGSIVIMIADKDLSCCSVASRVSSRQIQNLSCKCPMHSRISLALICAKRFRPNHLLPLIFLSYKSYIQLASYWWVRCLWSSLVELKKINWVIQWKEHLVSSSAMIFVDSQIAMQLLQDLPFWLSLALFIPSRLAFSFFVFLLIFSQR